VSGFDIKELLVRASDEAASTAFDADEDLWRARAARRRRRLRGASTALAVAVGAVALVLGIQQGFGKRAALVPADKEPNATSASATPSSTGPDRLEELFTSSELARLPSLPSLCATGPVAFSPNGARLAFGCERSTAVIDLPTGEPRPVGPQSLGVAWTADGSHLVLVPVQGTSVEVLDLHTLVPRTIELPAGWTATSVDVNAQGRVVLGGSVDQQLSAIMTMDLTGADPVVVSTRQGVEMYEPRWSPDGRTIGYEQRDGPIVVADIADIGVWTIGADGNDLRQVARYGKSAFVGTSPGFDWSPTGQMAFSSGAKVVTLGADGSPTTVQDATGPVAWRPAS
jgi:hypothetical protein